MKREKDLFAISQFLRTFIWLFFPFSLIGVLLGASLYGILGVILGMFAAGLLSLLVTPIILFILNAFGNAAGRLYTGPKARWTLREQLEGDLNKARHFKSRKEFRSALRAVNGILKEDSDFPEALFLKAQILVEGFRNPESAKGYLKRIMETTQNNATINRWALTYYYELKGK